MNRRARTPRSVDEQQMRASTARHELESLNRAFASECALRGLSGWEDLCWYHTVDLGDGLVTPGSYDYRHALHRFGFPGDMRGMNVLDIGSATGFFAFEFERRGATVVSVELPSMDAFDRFPGETLAHTISKYVSWMSEVSLYSDDQIRALHDPDTLYRCVVDGPFLWCHGLLQSKIKRVYSSVYDLTPAVVGRQSFDLVFVGDLLVHTLYFVKALAAIVPLCGNALVIAQDMPQTGHALQLWKGGTHLGKDDAMWWWPSEDCLKQILQKMGFATVENVGTYSGLLRPCGYAYRRTVLRAAIS